MTQSLKKYIHHNNELFTVGFGVNSSAENFYTSNIQFLFDTQPTVRQHFWKNFENFNKFERDHVCTLTLSYLSKISGYLYHQGFSTLEKNALICYQRAMLPIQSGVTALC